MGRPAEDLTGRRFGKLIVIKQVESTRKGRILWLCRCDCGNEKIAVTRNLKYGETTSCGCSRKLSQLKDITGNRYGKLVVIELSKERNKEGRPLWVCECECGKKVLFSQSQLRRGKKHRCGTDCKFVTNKYAFIGDIVEMYSSNGEFLCIFDKQDYEVISKRSWTRVQSGYLRTGFFMPDGKRKSITLTRYILNPPDGMYIDHISGDITDNRRGNLRICTATQNSMNTKRRKTNSSGMKGVRKGHTPNTWIASIAFNQNTIHLGTFYSYDEACQARIEAELKYFGEYSRREWEKGGDGDCRTNNGKSE